jgi:hypothetical protein
MGDALLAMWMSLGIRSDLAMASAFGAVFLVFYRHLTPRQAIGAVAGGVGTAIYFTPLAVRFLASSFNWFPADAPAERAVALLWGLLGSFVLAGLIVMGERFRKDPVKTVREIKP